MIRLPAPSIPVSTSLPSTFSLLTTAHPMLLVPKSSPKIRFIFYVFSVQNLHIMKKATFFAALISKAIHNKDYSVVKTLGWPIVLQRWAFFFSELGVLFHGNGFTPQKYVFRSEYERNRKAFPVWSRFIFFERSFLLHARSHRFGWREEGKPLIFSLGI